MNMPFIPVKAVELAVWNRPMVVVSYNAYIERRADDVMTRRLGASDRRTALLRAA